MSLVHNITRYMWLHYFRATARSNEQLVSRGEGGEERMWLILSFYPEIRLKGVKIKVKLSLWLISSQALCHEDIWGSGVLLHHSWLRHYMEVSCQLHASAALPLGKKPLVPIRNDSGWIYKCHWPRYSVTCSRLWTVSKTQSIPVAAQLLLNAIRCDFSIVCSRVLFQEFV
jgi:hypothetical protein